VRGSEQQLRTSGIRRQNSIGASGHSPVTRLMRSIKKSASWEAIRSSRSRSRPDALNHERNRIRFDFRSFRQVVSIPVSPLSPFPVACLFLSSLYCGFVFCFWPSGSKIRCKLKNTSSTSLIRNPAPRCVGSLAHPCQDWSGSSISGTGRALAKHSTISRIGVIPASAGVSTQVRRIELNRELTSAKHEGSSFSSR
jgi:hypothetical protein